MTSAMLLVGVPVNTGGISLALPAEVIAQTQQDQDIPKPAAAATPAPATLPAPTDPAQTAESEPMEVMVTAHQRTAGDPLEKLNATSFAVTQAVDKAVVAPVALTFVKVVPAPVRDGLNNFLFNIQEPKVFVNFVLQHKIGKAAETFARFFVNTTIGIGGLFDIAKRKGIRLPRRPNGFADTMGFYGVQPGTYLFLPIVGPTTIRDIVGSFADRALLPVVVGSPFNRVEFALPTSAGRTLDRRAAFDEDLRRMRSNDKDLYSQRRDLYLQMRQDEIDDLRGRPHTPIRSMIPTTVAPPKPLPAPPPTVPAPATAETPALIPAPAPGMPTP